MPDNIGAFLKASQCFSRLGMNITRVSYNKAIDMHMLFIDADGTPEQHDFAEQELNKIGYLQNDKKSSGVVLIEFCLRDEPGSVTDILLLIDKFDFNISYISSQENGTEYQLFKMGLYVEEPDKITEFLSEAEKICQVRIIDYNHTEKIYDNSIFYNSFVDGIAKELCLTVEMKERLLINTNLAMQTLDEQGLSPYKTFDSIGKFAHLIMACKGENFVPRVTTHRITDNTEIVLIEPPCGSNTTIIKSGNNVLFVDTGYACYRNEMEEIFHRILPDYDTMQKTVLLTHADLDHCGLLPQFDRIITSYTSMESLTAEYEGDVGIREENFLHRPYVNICKILTDYRPPSPDKIEVLWGSRTDQTEPLIQIGFIDFGDLHF